MAAHQTRRPDPLSDNGNVEPWQAFWFVVVRFMSSKVSVTVAVPRAGTRTAGSQAASYELTDTHEARHPLVDGVRQAGSAAPGQRCIMRRNATFWATKAATRT